MELHWKLRPGPWLLERPSTNVFAWHVRVVANARCAVMETIHAVLVGLPLPLAPTRRVQSQPEVSPRMTKLFLVGGPENLSVLPRKARHHSLHHSHAWMVTARRTLL